MKNIILFFLLLFPVLAFGQRTFYVNGLAGNYAMGDLKSFQQELQKNFQDNNILLKSVMDFPVSLQGEAGLDFEEGSLTYGGFVNYAITKGKLSYADYSGEAAIEQDVKRVLLGIKGSERLMKEFRIYGKLGVNVSLLDVLLTTSIHGAGSNEEKLGFYSLGLNLEPGLAWRYKFRSLVFNVAAGYEFNLQGRTHFSEEENAWLTLKNEEKVLIDWTGTRIGLGVGYVF